MVITSSDSFLPDDDIISLTRELKMMEREFKNYREKTTKLINELNRKMAEMEAKIDDRVEYLESEIYQHRKLDFIDRDKDDKD